MQVRPQRDWPRARSIQGLLQQRDGGMYARARLARSHPGVEKTFDRRGTARAGSTGMLRTADRCEERSRGPRAVAAPQERVTQHEPDSSGTERNRSSGSKRTGYSGVVQLTPGPRARTTQNTRPAPRLEHAYVTTGFDFGADRPVAPPLGHMTGRRRDSRTSVTLALSKSTVAVARPSAMGVPTVLTQPPGPPCARELRRQPRRTESQSRAAGGFARALARWAPCERL